MTLFSFFRNSSIPLSVLFVRLLFTTTALVAPRVLLPFNSSAKEMVPRRSSSTTTDSSMAVSIDSPSSPSSRLLLVVPHSRDRVSPVTTLSCFVFQKVHRSLSLSGRWPRATHGTGVVKLSKVLLLHTPHAGMGIFRLTAILGCAPQLSSVLALGWRWQGGGLLWRHCFGECSVIGIPTPFTFTLCCKDLRVSPARQRHSW